MAFWQLKLLICCSFFFCFNFGYNMKEICWVATKVLGMKTMTIHFHKSISLDVSLLSIAFSQIYFSRFYFYTLLISYIGHILLQKMTNLRLPCTSSAYPSDPVLSHMFCILLNLIQDAKLYLDGGFFQGMVRRRVHISMK